MDKKILLVDDAAFMRMLIKDTLTKNGYTNILEAADGAIWWGCMGKPSSLAASHQKRTSSRSVSSSRPSISKMAA